MPDYEKLTNTIRSLLKEYSLNDICRILLEEGGRQEKKKNANKDDNC